MSVPCSAGGQSEAEAGKDGGASADTGGDSSMGRVVEEEPAAAWAPAPAPLLAQCSDSEVAMLALVATSLGDPEEAATQLADTCGLSEEETMRLVGASADSDAPRVTMPPEASAGTRAWLTHHAIAALMGTPEADSAEPAAEATPSEAQALPSAAPEGPGAAGLLGAEGGSVAAAAAGHNGLGSWGNLELHEPLAWVMTQIMSKGLSLPDGTISQLPALKVRPVGERETFEMCSDCCVDPT